MVKTKKHCDSNTKGFTLIEVVLVLAIGGLIFLLAFLAFQQTSRNRRDSQRRSDLRKIAAELENFSVDNGGLYPSFLLTTPYAGTAGTYGQFQSEYLNNIKDPSTNTIYNYRDPWFSSPTLNASNLSVSLTAPGHYTYVPSWHCQTNNSVVNTSNFQNYFVAMRLETGIICHDNS